MTRARRVSVSIGAVVAIILALLAVSAPPVTAATATMQTGSQTVVGSQHTTTTDFQNAQTLTNLTVTDGTATLADVANNYNVVDDSGDGTAESQNNLVGDTNGNDPLNTEHVLTPPTTVTSSELTVDVSGTSGSDFGLAVDVYLVAEGPDQTYGEGTLIASNWNPDWQTGPQSIPLDSEVTLDGGQTYTLEFVSDSSDNDGGFDTLRVAADDSVTTTYWTGSNGATAERASDITAIGTTTPNSARYISQSHNVSGGVSTAINITQLSNATATAYLNIWDGSTWQRACLGVEDGDCSETLSEGNQTFALGDHSTSKYQIEIAVSVNGPNPAFSLADESILFNNTAPAASNLSPADGAKLTDSTVQFDVDISDPEFATPQGDAVEATLIVNNETAGSQTVSSNQSVSITAEVTGSQPEYYWRLEDSYGSVTTTDTHVLNTPSELRIYNITSVNFSSPELIDNASVEVRMYQNGTIYERTASNGVVNLSGISPSEPFVVVANADGYHSRRIFVTSLYERQTIYLLPESQPSVDVIFNLQEYTGRYPQEDTILQVERAVNGSWETVLGDYFGANAQFPATVEYNTRYRLRLINIETGQERLLGSFTPLASSTQNVVVAPRGDVSVTSVDAVWEFLETKSMPATTVPFNATLQTGESTINSWNLSVTYVTENGTSEQLYHVNSSTAANRSIATDLNLSKKAGGEVRVVAAYELENGFVQTVTRSYRVSEYFANENALIPSLTQFVSLVPQGNQAAFTTFLAMMLTVLGTAGIMYTVPMSTEIAGLIAWLFLAAFGVLGWVGYEMVFVAGVAAGSLVYLRRPI